MPRETPTFSPPCGADNTGRASSNQKPDRGHRIPERGRGVPTSAQSRYVVRVLWLGRPPYLRWIAATTLVVAGLVWDISERATEPFPFAASDLNRGQVLEPEDIEWRPVPSGSLVMPDLNGATAATPIRSGDPIVPSLVAVGALIPSDSWAVPVPLPLGAGPGMFVRLVFADGSWTSGVIVQPAIEDSFGLISQGLVAVEGDAANSVALATSNGDLIVLIEP